MYDLLRVYAEMIKEGGSDTTNVIGVKSSLNNAPIDLLIEHPLQDDRRSIGVKLSPGLKDKEVDRE